MPTAVSPANAIDETGFTDAAWNTIDVTNEGVPTGKHFAIILAVCSAANQSVQVRGGGSTDNRTASQYIVNGANTIFIVRIGEGADLDEIDIYATAFASNAFHVLGYGDSDECVLFQNFTDLTNTIDTWTDQTVGSGGDTAIGVIAQFTGNFNGQQWGIRPNGSTHDTAASITTRNGGTAMVGVDGSEGYECYIDTTNNDWWEAGYVLSTSDWTFHTDPTDRHTALSSSGTYESVASPALGATWGCYEVERAAGTQSVWMRSTDEETDDFYNDMPLEKRYHPFVALGTGDQCEVKRESTGINVWEWGYFVPSNLGPALPIIQQHARRRR